MISFLINTQLLNFNAIQSSHKNIIIYSLHFIDRKYYYIAIHNIHTRANNKYIVPLLIHILMYHLRNIMSSVVCVRSQKKLSRMISYSR